MYMKKRNKVVKGIIVVLFVLTITLHNSAVYASASGYDEVSTRELAMLASLVYEDVPNDNRYVGTTANLGCYEKNGKKKAGTCFYTALEGNTSSDVKLKGSKYHIWQYIEGLSERKMNSAVSLMTAAFQEDGQKYYFLNFADTSEMNKWNIVNSESKRTSSLSKKSVDFNWDGVFDAITFKKGNNYVIAFRGTDYPDLYEWLQDVAYALNGKHKQARLAYEYAQSEYDRIIKENEDAKIYVTGHSLGAYLAQVGGAAIIDKEAGQTNPDRKATDYSDFDLYNEDYFKGESHLVQVAYFNGMGVGGIFTTSDFTKNIDNALIYLSTHNADGSMADGNRLVNYSSSQTNIKSSGRLVLYSLDADPVSDIGIHYGEIYKLGIAADAINNHHQKHESFIGDTLSSLLGSLGNKVEEKDNQSVGEQSKVISSISENIYNIINNNETLNKKYSFIPTAVSKVITKENNDVPIINYEITSLLANLSKDVADFSDKYKNIKITNLFDHFNMNHETDSFVCLIDKDYGKITTEKINLTVSNSDSKNIKCYNKDGNSTCYTNKEYSVSDYTLGENIITNNDNNIVITASVNGGCANSYTWYYSSDGKNFEKLGTTVIKQIIVPKDKIIVSENSSQKLYFKVIVDYGNKYTETKLVASNSEVNFRYSRVNESTTVNPTLINDEISDSEGTAESNALEVNYVYDTISPTCSFNISKLSIVRGTAKNIKLNCDDTSPIKFETSNLKLSPKGINDGFTYTPNCNDYDKVCNITVRAKPYEPLTFPTNNQTLNYYGEIYDYAGNSVKVSNWVSLKRVKQ